ncbi:hypothetical protein BU23DRAFT_540096 [Bimuria novae-zelandiae CBS 107.79]|uniref:Enhancer of mRNA-decapping protein 3 n=1 Tax=Bimuria novae-zelandiae CBS 107.79 TaxID=1447943 RepID=A0A6A5UVQ2_9PLEO|nr:hypothetical protein BU23DRAFT_540096 [Bimuria novae-zelandiae CBS 107.79]
MAASIKDRIAALNIEQVHAPSPTSRPTYTYEQAASTKKKPPPPPPSHRPPAARHATVNNPPVHNAPTSTRQLGNQPAPAPPDTPAKSPALPPRPPPRNKQAPSLPPRQPSQAGSLRRSNSKESIASIATNASSISHLSLDSVKTTTSNGTSNGRMYTVRAPAYDPTSLPPLPTKKTEDPKQNSSIKKAMRSSADVASPKALPPRLPLRTSPPQLPSRPALPARPTSKAQNQNAEREQKEMPRRLPPPDLRPALELGFNNKETAPPIPTSRPESGNGAESAPPPVPLSSRPNLDAIMASKPKPGALPTSCLICRDFSAPDQHAAQFPRNNLPSSDVTWLATQLTAPFPSPTDKARAIFAWLHHNVDYDCHSFFSGTISPSTPERTITSGLAVCEGYAGLFAALALKAGLEAIVVGGDGKGFGHSPLKPGDPVPPFKSSHAWNAVRIDNGQWKLIDACWGAGSLGCPGNVYNRHFKPAEFTKSNIDFGYTHYPENQDYLFREDGRVVTWEEYCMDDAGERLQIYGDPEGEHGVGRRTFQPPMKHIKVHDPHDPVIRFQFAVSCPHWDHERHGKGKPYVMTLNIGGRDGRNSQHIPFNTDGRSWWLDVNRIDLGAPGQKINVCAITSFDNKDGRGLTIQQFKAKQGKVASGWGYLCCWELVNCECDAVSRLLDQATVEQVLSTYFTRSPALELRKLALTRLHLSPKRHLTCCKSPTSLEHASPRLVNWHIAIMATALIGISVTVTLQNPPNTVVEGLVANVNAQTSTLTLQNVFFPASGHRLSSYHVEGHAIADIKVNHAAASAQTPQQTPLPIQHQPSYPQYPQNIHPPAPPAVRPPPQPFVDPAILSMGKRTSAAPTPVKAPPGPPQEAPATPMKAMAAASTASLPKNTSPFVGAAKQRSVRKPSAATLEGPFSSLDIADAEEPDSDDKTVQSGLRRASITKTRSGKPMEDPVAQPAIKSEENNKRTRRGGKARKKEVAALERRNGTDFQSSPDAARKTKGNGWRQTPMLQDPEPQNRTPGLIGGRVGLQAANASNRKTRRQRAMDATNGWATEDATDIQDLPEFDFASNLSKFDKRTVFDQIRNEDTTADEDRLVSFNRLARPGTYGGKNLHPSENVLDGKKARSASNSSSEEDLSDFGSGRNSRRAMSRASIKRAPTRQGSGVQGDIETQGLPGAPILMTRAANRSFIHRPAQYASSSHATGSPKPGRIATPPDSPLLDSTSKSCLRIANTNRKCHTITPGGMLAVEEVAEVDYGLTEEIMAESAGRGIAEVALSAINPGGRRLARDNPNGRPVIVVLAGNHRGGARAVAAARHLNARGPKVMVALLGFERNADWDRDVRRQVDLFKKFGGSVRAWPNTEDALKRLQAPPELIIDALLGRHREFDALGDEDRRTTLSIVGWANKSRAAVLAVESPSGVGGSTGEVAILEGEPLEVRAKYIVCLGAPRSGLLKALQNGAGRDPRWAIWVVDIGVNRPWRNAGVGGGKGIKFGEEWAVQVEFVEG